MTRTRIIVIALVLALGLAFGTRKKASSLESPDFKVFYTAARHALTDPENIYRISPDRYLYPPSTAILLVPFAFSDEYRLHQWIWHGLLGLVLFGLASVGGSALAAMILLIRYLAITFSYGQINLVVIGLLALTGWAGRKGAWSGAGSIWALATSLKVYPAVLAPFFLPRSRWIGFVFASLVGLLLFFSPFLFFGVTLGTQLYSEFFASLESKGLPLHSHNQSIAAFLQRVFTAQEFYLHAVGPNHWGILDLPVPFLRSVAWLVGVLLVTLSWRRAWQRGLYPAAALSAAAFSILFLSHIVWKDYLLFLYFPLSEVLARLPRKQAWGVAGAFLVLVTFSSPDIVGHPVSTRLDAASIHLWAGGLVWWAWWKNK